jgi:hypothetical protein
MVEIASGICPIYLNVFRKILILSGILFISPNLSGQNLPAQPKPGKRMIEVLHADSLMGGIEKNTGKKLDRLLGKVSLRHKEIYMDCDSAYYYTGYNQIKAYSKIYMEQGDTLHLRGDSLFYDGSLEEASVDGNVELIDKETHLYTNSVKYDVSKKIARYNDGGRIINGKNTLTSIIGIYYVSENLFHFKDSVKIVNPDYVMIVFICTAKKAGMTQKMIFRESGKMRLSITGSRSFREIRYIMTE